MKMKKLRKRRYLAMLLVFVLCMGMLDISAFAAAPGENIAAGAEQKAGSGQEADGGQTTGDTQTSGDSQTGGDAQTSEGSQTGGDTQMSGGSQTGGDVQTSEGSQTGGDVQTSGGSQTGGDAQTSGGSQTDGDVQTSGGSQTGGDVQTSGGSQTDGDVQTSGDSQTSENIQNTGAGPEENVETETGGDTESGENQEETAIPENAAAEDFWAAVEEMGETDDEDSVRATIEKILSIYGRLSEEDKADEAVQKAYEELKAYAENLGQDEIELLDEDETYTVIYKDSAAYGGRELARHTGLHEGDATPRYDNNTWFLEENKKEVDFEMWSPTWKSTVGGENHTIIYTAVYKNEERYLLTIYYQWAGTGGKEAAPDYKDMLLRGDSYTVTSPTLEVPFEYEVSYPVISGSVEGATHDIKRWVNYTPKAKIQHVYRINGKVVGIVDDTIVKKLPFGQTLTENSFGISKKYNYGGKYYQYTSADTVTLPSDPSQLTEQPVLKLYYDQSAPELEINKTANKTEVKPGEEVTYTIQIKNVGPAPANGVKVTDSLPDGLEFVNYSYTKDSYSYGPYKGRPSRDIYQLSTIKSGTTVTLKITAKVKDNVAADTTITNTATAVADNRKDATPSDSADITVAKTYPLTVGFRWATADGEYIEAAPLYRAWLKDGEAYSVPIPEAEVPFAYTTSAELDGRGNLLNGVMDHNTLADTIWIDYYPLFQVNHIYRRDGDVVGYALWDENAVSWYADNALSYIPNYKSLTYCAFKSEISTAWLFRYPWVFWDPEKPNEYETFTFTSEDTVTLPGNPAELKATPVINMYYDKTTYVDLTVRYIYETEDGTQTELLEEYKETLAKKSSYDVSGHIPETITVDGLSYRRDSVDGDLTGTAAENRIITVKYVIVEETPENPTEPENPTPPTPPVTPPGGGGGRTPDPTPEPPAPGPGPVIPTPAEPVPDEPVPAAVTPNVTPVTPTVVAAEPEEQETVTAEIGEERVPLADGNEPEIRQTAEVEEEEVPLAGGEGGSWALFNFALMNLAIFESIMLLIGYFVRTKNDEDERKLKKKGLFRMISLPVAVISLVVFVLTENIHLQTALVDKYTVVMLLIAVVQTVMVVLSNKKYEEEQEAK